MRTSACAFTGHRPSSFSFRYNENDEKCLKIKELLRAKIETLIKKNHYLHSVEISSVIIEKAGGRN